MAHASLIATLLDPPSLDGADLTALPEPVEWLEVRADRVGDIDPDWLRQYFKGRLIYAYRDRSEDRAQRLLDAARRGYDRIELEAETDLSEEILKSIPAEKRLVSWYGKTDDLIARFELLTSIPAALYKLVTKATTIAEEFQPLSLLKSLQRDDTIAFADGPLGFWTRVVALHLGAPAIYGVASRAPMVEMEPSIGKLIVDYGLPEFTPAKELFAIIGDPIFHSLSPALHNASYRAMNHPALFVPLRVESFNEFWQEFVLSHKLDALGIPVNGMTVASPHKEEAVRTAKFVSGMVRQTEAANILVRNNGWWRADTTDPDVVYKASADRSVKAKRAAVIGCGGAGRAIAAALVESGAGVTLINRGAKRGERAAAMLGLHYVPLREFDAEGYDIVVNATPVGRDTDEVPFDVEHLNDDAVVIDLVYGSRPTPLIGTTRARHQIAIDGRDVLVTQVSRQFQLMTGKEMPIPKILKVLS